MIGFAVRNDGEPGFRAINEIADLLPNEEFSGVQPPDNSPLPPTTIELDSEAKSKQSELLAAASLQIAPLQYAAELGVSTKSEDDSLKLWKLYMIELNRVSAQPSYPASINWPVAPK